MQLEKLLALNLFAHVLCCMSLKKPSFKSLACFDFVSGCWQWSFFLLSFSAFYLFFLLFFFFFSVFFVLCVCVCCWLDGLLVDWCF